MTNTKTIHEIIRVLKRPEKGIKKSIVYKQWIYKIY